METIINNSNAISKKIVHHVRIKKKDIDRLSHDKKLFKLQHFKFKLQVVMRLWCRLVLGLIYTIRWIVSAVIGLNSNVLTNKTY